LIQTDQVDERTFKTLETEASFTLSEISSLEVSKDELIEEISKMKPSIMERSKTANSLK